jgi:glycosyltransferase involved in cell wall biosynthesis
LIRELSDNIVVVEATVGYESFWKRLWWDQYVLRKILSATNVDVLVSSSDFGMLLPPCRQILLIRNALFFSRLYQQLIVPKQSRRTQLAFRFRRRLILASAQFSDRVVLASQAMMEEVRRFLRVPLQRIEVNHFGAPLARFAKVNGGDGKEASPKAFRILYVSEYGDYKNFTTLFKAVKILASGRDTNFTLLTTADPWQSPQAESVTREVDQQLATDPLVKPFVICVGYLSYESVPDLYANSDLLVFPSIAESFGHPLVEAMASVLPVLASDIPICREICGEAALYFNACDPQDLADKVLLLWRDIDSRNKMGRAGRERAELYFDWRDHVQSMVTLIEEVGNA